MTYTHTDDQNGEARRDAIGRLVSRYPAISRKEHEKLVRLLDQEVAYHRDRTGQRAEQPPPHEFDKIRDDLEHERKQPLSLRLVLLLVTFVVLLTVLRALSRGG